MKTNEVSTPQTEKLPHGRFDMFAVVVVAIAALIAVVILFVFVA